MSGPQIGSRVWALSRLEPGERLLLEAPAGRTSAFMQQVSTDVGRAGLRGALSQSLVVGVKLDTRDVIDIVCVTRA